jgi:hypothetical protein
MAVFSLPSFRHIDDLVLFNALALHANEVLHVLTDQQQEDDMCKVGPSVGMQGLVQYPVVLMEL